MILDAITENIDVHTHFFTLGLPCPTAFLRSTFQSFDLQQEHFGGSGRLAVNVSPLRMHLRVKVSTA